MMVKEDGTLCRYFTVTMDHVAETWSVEDDPLQVLLREEESSEEYVLGYPSDGCSVTRRKSIDY